MPRLQLRAATLCPPEEQAAQEHVEQINLHVREEIAVIEQIQDR